MSWSNAGIAVALALWFLIAPGVTVIGALGDPALQAGEAPRLVWRVHRQMAPRYERWARARIASGKAAEVYYRDVPGTEWPLFGSVFYMWATENLQAAWEKDHTLSREAPAVYARDAVEACKDLILDPVHHGWVRTHWGDDYMHDRNVFFRSLLIAGLTSYQRLTGSREYETMLRDQANTLAQDLDASRYGVLDDYPGECYPLDVFAAVAFIHRADRVLGTDHSAFFARERRAFEGDRLDRHGLVPWRMDPRTGRQWGEARGISNSHILICAPELYPDLAKKWFATYLEYFWQDKWYGAGFREYYRDVPGSDWTYDVDAGPIVGGFSPAANGFGVAATRKNGRLDLGYTLAAQMLAASWPLPDGRFLGGRLLSDPRHAPYLGELAILWQLSETAASGVETVKGGRITGAVYIGLAFYLLTGLAVIAAAALRLRRSRRLVQDDTRVFPRPAFQATLWTLLTLAGLVLLARGSLMLGLLFLILAQWPPLTRRANRPTADSDSSPRANSV